MEEEIQQEEGSANETVTEEESTQENTTEGTENKTQQETEKNHRKNKKSKKVSLTRQEKLKIKELKINFARKIRAERIENRDLKIALLHELRELNELIKNNGLNGSINEKINSVQEQISELYLK